MKFKAFSFAFFMATALLMQGCGTDTTSGDTELAAVLDAAADREGVGHGECRDGCAAAALSVFDECTADGEPREACFGKAIHSFYECGGECEPATCEDECQARVTEELAECIELTGNEEACGIESRELLALCIDEFCGEPDPKPDPEPTTCEEGCGKLAEHVYDACMSKIDSEEHCAAMAHRVLEHCIDRCQGHPCDCYDDSDSDSDTDSDSDSDSGDSDSDEDKDCGGGASRKGEGKGCK